MLEHTMPGDEEMADAKALGQGNSTCATAHGDRK